MTTKTLAQSAKDKLRRKIVPMLDRDSGGRTIHVHGADKHNVEVNRFIDAVLDDLKKEYDFNLVILDSGEFDNKGLLTFLHLCMFGGSVLSKREADMSLAEYFINSTGPVAWIIVLRHSLRLDEFENSLARLFRIIRNSNISVTLILAGSKVWTNKMEQRTRERMGGVYVCIGPKTKFYETVTPSNDSLQNE